MTVREPSTTCRHDVVETVGLVPDPGGQMRELSQCRGCGTRLMRTSPLDAWMPAGEED